MKNLFSLGIGLLLGCAFVGTICAGDKKKDPEKKSGTVDWQKLLAELRERFATSVEPTLQQTRIDRAYFDLNTDDPDQPPFLVFKGVCLRTVHDDEAKMKEALRKELSKFPLPNFKYVLKIDQIQFLDTPIYKLQDAAVAAFKADATFNVFFERAAYGADGRLRLHVLCLRTDPATDDKIAELLRKNPVGGELIQLPDGKTKTPLVVRRDYDWLGDRLAQQRKFAGDADPLLQRTRLSDGYLHYSKDGKTIHFNVSGVCIHPPGLVADAEREKRWKERVSNLFPKIVYEPSVADIAMVPNPSIAWQNDLAANPRHDGAFFQLAQFDGAGELAWAVKLPSELHRYAVLKVIEERPAPIKLAPVAEKAPAFQLWTWYDVLPRGQARLAEGDFLLHRARLDRVFLKYDDPKLGDPYLHIEGVSLHPTEVEPDVLQRQKLERALKDLLPSALAHKWHSEGIRFVTSPIYALQAEAVGRNLEGMLFADGRYDKNGKLHLLVAVGTEGQKETVRDIVASTKMPEGAIGSGDDKDAPQLEFTLLAWDEFFEQMQRTLARDTDTLLRKTRVERGFFSYPASKVGPDLNLSAVGIYPKQDVLAARVKKRFDLFADLYLKDRLRAGPVASVPMVQNIENPAPVLQAKIPGKPALDGARVDDVSFDGAGKLVFHGIWTGHDQEFFLENLVLETLTSENVTLKRGINWSAMAEFDSPRLLLQMRTWITGQEDIDEVWLERFYFDAVGKVRVTGFSTRNSDHTKAVGKLPDFLPVFESKKLPAIDGLVPEKAPVKEPEKKEEKKDDAEKKQKDLVPVVFLQGPKDDVPIQLATLVNIAQYLRDNIPKVDKCDGLRIDRCFYDPQGVFRIDGLADHADHTAELKRFLDDEKAPFDRKRQLAEGWKDGKQTVIPLRPMTVSLQENLPSAPEFDGLTLYRAHHDPKNRLILTGTVIGEFDEKEQAVLLKKLLETHPRWRLRTTAGLGIEITNRQKANKDLATKNVLKALHLLQVTIGEAYIEPPHPTCASWWSHGWIFDPRLPRVRPTNDDYDRCIDYLDAALLHNPQDVLAWYLRAYCYQTRSRSDLSLRDLRRMVVYEIDDPDLRHQRILALELVQGVLRQSAYRIEQEAELQVSEGFTLRELRESPAARDTTGK